ncbi:armadillo repeat-containing protein 2-like [Uloborus diversus]|uniref:armadillo repeat-containing protein 2-like n=1 Tax=Uloborus diversus TaxID=327109 RepID=UPI002409EA06|nr:armadillo repeat-containing protein 2-like [Uloborus diversus]
MSTDNPSSPFYAHPMDRKRSVLLVKEAKAEIKKLESYRPITPFGHGEKVSDSPKNFLETSRNECFELEEDFPLVIPDDACSSEESKTIADVACLNSELGAIQDSSLQSDITEKTLIDEVSKEVAKFLPLLEKYIRQGKKKKEKDVISIVSDIYQLLSYNNAFETKLTNRISLLKSLFKLLDAAFPALCFNVIKLLLEIVSALHFISCNKEAWNILIIPANTVEILKVLKYSSDVPEIVQITVRLLSKIVDGEGGCDAVVECSEDLLLAFNQILLTYKLCIDIIVQATFIVGNIVSSNENVALLFFTMPTFKKILIDILEEYVGKHLQFKGHVSELIKSDESGDRNWYRDIFEVITKVLCILANVCLSPKAGLYLAQENHLIMHLLKYIGKYTSESITSDTTVPLYSFLVVVNNITYFLSPESPMCIHIAERIIPLLDENFAYEVRLEAANISQNLTRSTEVRKFILDKSLLPAFINLLSEDDKEFNVVSYGIMMNILLDPDSRKIFYEEQGLTRVLHKLHLCGYRDWKMSALLCQILWNYFGGSNADNVPISRMELQHLIKCLSFSIYNEKNDELIVSEDQVAWRNEFCPVAKNLLQLLQSKLPSTSS